MSRLSIHLSVDAVVPAIAFYSELFGMPPTQSDVSHAEWQDDSLGLDFMISRRKGGEVALIRLGLPLPDPAALADLTERLPPVEDIEPSSNDVRWLLDPAGVLWEAFHQPEARRLATPTRAEFIAARLTSDEEARLHAFVTRRRLMRRRSSGYAGRSEARM